jgi:hypothetical protein
VPGRAFGHDGAAPVVTRSLAVVAALSAALVAPSCKRDDSGEPVPTLSREGDAALVVFVDRTASGVAFEDEREPNDTLETAQALNVPGGVRGTLDGEVDEDFYRIELEEEAMVSALVSGASDVDLILDVLDARGELVVRSDRGPKGISEGVPNLALEPGVYYVKIHEFVRGRERGGERARQGPSEAYELVLERRELKAGYEAEPNDRIETASELELDRDALGFIGWHRDVDLWRVPLAGVLETDGFDITLSGVPWLTPKLELLDPDGEVLLSREGERGQPVAIHNLAPHHALGEGADGSDALYLRVSSARSNPEEPYRLRVTQRDLDPSSELEPNHEPHLATPLRDELDEVEGERRGHLDRGDVDVYRLGPSPGTRSLYVTVEPSSGVRARVEVRIAGEVVASSDEVGRGASATAEAAEIAAGVAAEVVVRGDASEPMGGPYRLRWSLH